MAHKLVTCVAIPHVLAHIARQRLPASTHPLVVATHPGDRALVVDVCPQAAAFGLRPGIFVGHARRQCPSLLVAPRDDGATARALEQVEQVLHAHADTVARHRPGCWTLSLSALGRHFTRAPAEARRLQQEVTTETTFPCVVGLGGWSGIARIAADVAQQCGQPAIVVLPGTERSFLAPLPVDALPGVGPRTTAELQRLGITTAGQLADMPAAVVVGLCGSRGHALVREAQGLDPGATPCLSDTVHQTWQASHAPCADARRLHAQLHLLAAQVGQRLRARKLGAGALTVRLTWTDGTTQQRTVHCTPRRDLDRDLAAACREAFAALLAERRLAVVQLAVVAGDLGPVQQDLFATDDARLRQLQQALDTVRQRFGPGAILPGSLLGLATSVSSSVL